MKKWAIWKTILVVISSVILVAGITVGGVYLAGGFDRKSTYPNELEFVIDDLEFNSDTGRYETTKDFTMTINGINEDVDEITEKTIYLSLDNEIKNDDRNTKRNDVLVIPSVCEIGKPFTVTLNTAPLYDDDKEHFLKDPETNEDVLNWIKGGISTITATSNNSQGILTKSVTIAVDTPVFDVKTEFYDTSDTNFEHPLTKITLEENFVAKPVFIPQSSTYLYGATENDPNKIERKVFYETESAGLRRRFENGNVFFTAERINQYKLNVYAFRNADVQQREYEKILAENDGNIEVTYELVTNFLRADDEVPKVKRNATVNVEEESITSFEISNTSNITLTYGQEYRLTLQRNTYANGYIGASINNGNLKSMLKNVAVRLVYLDDDANGDWSKAKEVPDDIISIYGDGTRRYLNDGEQEIDGQVVKVDGKNYHFVYETRDVLNSYWILKSHDLNNRRIRAIFVLLEKKPIEGNENKEQNTIFTEDGQQYKYKVFATSSGVEQTYQIEITSEPINDQDVKWNIEGPINITLTSNGDSVSEHTLQLLQYKDVPVANDFQDVKFFIYFEGENKEDRLANARTILGENYESIIEEDYAGFYDRSFGGKFVYPIPDNIQIKNVGNFEIYFATIEMENRAPLIKTSRYSLIKSVANPLQVIVKKTLHEKSVESFRFELKSGRNPSGNKYYFPLGHCDDEIEIRFDISEDSSAVFAEKFRNKKISLNIIDENKIGNDKSINEYFDITEQYISSPDSQDYRNYIISLKLKITDSIEFKISDIIITDLENTDLYWQSSTLNKVENDKLKNNYVFYSPVPNRIEVSSDTIDFEQLIIVEQTLSNNGITSKIRYNCGDDENIPSENGTPINSIGELINLFNVVIYDQYDDSSIFKDKSNWTLKSTTNQNVIFVTDTLNGPNINFATSSEQGDKVELVFAAKNNLSIDTSGGNTLKFFVKSTGIVSAEETQTDTIGEEELEKSSDFNFDINKYAMTTGGEIVLKNLFALYLDGDELFDPENYKVQFASSYLSLNENDFEELYKNDKDNNMIDIYVKGSVDCYELNNSDDFKLLAGQEIEKIKINKNFGRGHVINFEIRDNIGNRSSGIINFPLNLTIMQNATATGSASSQEIYAGEEYTLNGAATYSVRNEKVEGLSDIITTKSNIVKDGDGRIFINNIGYARDVDIIGTVDGEKFTFNDFFDVDSKTYNIIFYPEGTDNSFAPSTTIRVVVQRNIIIKEGTPFEQTYDVLNNSGGINLLENGYIKINRHDDQTPIDDTVSNNISLAIEENPYFIVHSTEKTISRKSNAIPVFPYGKTELIYKITVFYNSEIELGSVDLVVTSAVSYQDIADRLQQKTESQTTPVNAEVSKIFGVNYLEVTSGSWTLLNQRDVAKSEYTLAPIRTYSDDKSSDVIGNFQITDGNYTIPFIAPTINGFSGKEDNTHFFIVSVQVGTTQNFVLYIPIIVSRLGTYQAVFDGKTDKNQFAETEDLLLGNKKIEDRATDLIKEGKFKKTEAGKNYIFASRYTDKNLLTDYEIGAENKKIKDAEKEAGLYYYTAGKPEAINNVILNIQPVMFGRFTQAEDGSQKFVEDKDLSNLVYGSVLSYSAMTNEDKISLKVEGGDDLDNDSYILRLNHFVGEENEKAYIIFKILIDGQTYSETIYYIVEAEADTQQPIVTYPYDGKLSNGNKTEYVQLVNNAKTIELDEIFNYKTKHDGDTRFTIKSLNGETLTNLPRTYQVKSVSNEVGQLSNWTKNLSVEFIQNKDESGNLKDQVKFTVFDTSIYSVVITRNYSTVVGGDVDYCFTLNENSQYSLDYEKNKTELKNGKRIWTVNEFSKETDSEDRFANLQINLKTIGGSSEITVYEKLECIAYSIDKKYVKWFAYNSKAENINVLPDTGKESADPLATNKITINSNTLQICVADYFDRDYEFELQLYTEFGFLETLVVKIKGSVEIKEENKTLTASDTIDIAELFEVSSYNGKPLGDVSYSIQDAYISSFEDDEVEDACKYAEVKQDTWTLITYPNIEDKEITLTIVLLIDGNDFTFNIENIRISKNIEAKTQNSIPNIIALADTETEAAPLTLPDDDTLFTGSLGENAVAKYSWSSQPSVFTSSSTPVEEISIKPSNVSMVTECTLTITIHFYKKDTTTEICKLENVIYKFNVFPNVTIGVNYPAPENTELDCEYVEDQQEFTIKDSNDFMEVAPFIDANNKVGNTTRNAVANKGKIGEEDNKKYPRFAINSVIKDLESGDFKSAQLKAGTEYTITVESLTNASIEYIGNGVTAFSDTNPSLLNIGGYIYGKDENGRDVTVDAIRFRWGTWQDSKDDMQAGYVRGVENPVIRLRITCNEVYAFYTIKIVDDLYQLSFNRAVDSVDLQNNEIIYVENLTNSLNIFEKDRMAILDMSATAYSAAPNHQVYLLFEKEPDEKTRNYQYKEFHFVLKTSYNNEKITIDLGESYAEYKLVGAYAESQLSKTSTSKYTTTDVNYADRIFKDGTLELTSRVNLSYATYQVDYDMFEDSLTYEKAEDENPTLSTYQAITKDADNNADIDEARQLTGFKYNGKELKNITSYNYIVTVDIDVAQKVVVTGDAVTQKPTDDVVIYAKENKNLIETMGITHPSSGNLLTTAELALKDANSEISLEVLDGEIEENKTDNFNTLVKSYYGENGATNAFYLYHDSNKQQSRYLAISPTKSLEERYTDYILSGEGAGNNGNYILLKFTYSVTQKIKKDTDAEEYDEIKFAKDFYLVVKVMPDYIVGFTRGDTFDSSQENVKITNEEQPHSITQINSNNGLYSNFVITGQSGGDQGKVVSVTHKFGDATDVGSSAFDYSITTQESGNYNLAINVINKLNLGGNSFAPTPSTSDSTPTTYTRTARGNTFTMTNVNVVHFGDQTFKLDAVDDFGFQFEVFFKLVATNDNNLSLSIDGLLTEGKEFDLGVSSYQSLYIYDSKQQDGGKTILTTNVGQNNVYSSDVSLLKIEGLTAYGYDNNLGELEINGSKVFSGNSGIFYEIDSEKFELSDSRYKAIPTFANIRIIDIEFLDKDGKPFASSLKAVDNAEKKNQEGEEQNNENMDFHKLATSSQLKLFKDPDDDTRVYRDPVTNFIVPTLPGEAYGDGKNDTAEINIRVRLGYAKEGITKLDEEALSESNLINNFEEIYPLESKITVQRTIQIKSQTNKVVRDGVTFDIGDKIYVQDINNSDNDERIKDYTHFYDNTLIVEIPAYDSVSFKIQLENGEEKPITETNRVNYAVKEYLSISDLLDTTLNKNSKFKLTFLPSQANLANGKLKPEIKFEYGGQYIFNAKDDTSTYDPNHPEIEITTDSTDGYYTMKKFTNDEDTIYIENPSRMNEDNQTNITKYYLVSVPENIDTVLADRPEQYDTVEYTYSQQYLVTGYYARLEETNTGSTHLVSGDDVEGGGYSITIDKWAADLTLQILEMRTGGTLSPTTPETHEKIKKDDLTNGIIYIKINSDDGDVSGAATIDLETGTITTDANYDIDSHYISLSIYLRVSGEEHNFKYFNGEDYEFKYNPNETHDYCLISSYKFNFIKPAA